MSKSTPATLKPIGKTGKFLGWLLTGVGIALCLTLAGAIAGIPMILFGVAFLKTEERSGDCPYCGHQVRVIGRVPGMDCPACKKRILVKGDRFESID